MLAHIVGNGYPLGLVHGLPLVTAIEVDSLGQRSPVRQKCPRLQSLGYLSLLNTLASLGPLHQDLFSLDDLLALQIFDLELELLVLQLEFGDLVGTNSLDLPQLLDPLPVSVDFLLQPCLLLLVLCSLLLQTVLVQLQLMLQLH